MYQYASTYGSSHKILAAKHSWMSAYLLDLTCIYKKDKRQTGIYHIFKDLHDFFFLIFKGLLFPTARLQEKGFEIFLGKLATEAK